MSTASESAYGPSYYDDHRAWARASAEAAVPVVMELLSGGPASAIDVGCGSGEWLAEFQRAGVQDVVGVDGPWVSEESLAIPSGAFVDVDLASAPEDALRVGRRFDLVVSLEVAEHLPPSSAPAFVQTLTGLGDLVLFSAAVPGQGGRGHQNEQWPSVWAGHFAEHGYAAVDVLRPRLWEDTRVAWWYRQNVLLFVSLEGVERHPGLRDHVVDVPLALVHPEALDEAREIERGYREWVEMLEEEVRAVRAFEPGRVSFRGAVTALPSLFRHAVRQRLSRRRPDG